VEEQFLNAPVVTIAEANGSKNRHRISVIDVVMEVTNNLCT